MSDPTPFPPAPPSPPPDKSSVTGKWVFWIVSAAVLPGLAFAVVSGGTALEPIGSLIFLVALLGQIIGSIRLGIALSRRLGKGAGMAVLLVLVLLVSSVAVGTASALASCAVVAPNLNFH